MKRLVAIGFGYSARAAADLLRRRGWTITGTTRSPEKAASMAAAGIEPVIFDGTDSSSGLSRTLARADAVIVSIAPDEKGDPVLISHACDLTAKSGLHVVYLSTVGVYGDHDGGWVDETTACRPVSKRSVMRRAAEEAWKKLAADNDLSLDIFRLAGIYGHGRNPFERLRRGTARALIKPGQVFNRIHVADIAAAIAAAVDKTPTRGRARVVNITDDEPAPPQDAIWYAADLAGIPRPAPEDLATADLSPMARSFYGECKRVRNARLRRDLGLVLRYPTYREGLGALWAAGAADI